MSTQNNNEEIAQIKAFLQLVALKGLEDINELPQYMKYVGSGKDIARAMIAFFMGGERLLLRFANALSSAYSIGIKINELNEFVNTMNRGYIAQININDVENSNIADEILFWDGCSITEAKIYFGDLCEKFIKNIEKINIIPDYAYAIIETQPHSEAMAKLQIQIMENVRNKLIGNLALKAEPKQRLAILLRYASDKKTTALIDDELWNRISDEICLQCKSNINTYLELRNTLLLQAQKQEEIANYALLRKLNSMIVNLDTQMNWGTVFNDPKAMLEYWRIKRFEGVFEEAILIMYQNLIANNPKSAVEIAKQDYDTLKNKGQNQQLVSLLKNVAKGEKQEFEQRRNDGVGERNKKAVKKAKKPIKRINYIYLIYAIILAFLIFFIGTLTIRNLSAPQRKPRPAPAQTPKTTKTPQKQKETPKPTPQKKVTPKPTETPKSTQAPEPEIVDDIELEQLPDHTAIVDSQNEIIEPVVEEKKPEQSPAQ